MSGLRWTIGRVKKSIKEIHSDEITIDESTYCGMEKKCRFIDKDHGEWWTTPSKIIHRKQGHKIRGPEKAKKKWLEKYGVDNPLKCPEILDKVKSTCMERYGVDNPAKNPEIAQKASDTFSAKTDQEIADTVRKREKTCMLRYGVKNPLLSEKIKAKAINTLMANHGVNAPAKSPKILAKMKATCIERYGVDNPSKHPDIIKKIESIMMEKYGKYSPREIKDYTYRKLANNLRRRLRDAIKNSYQYGSVLKEIGCTIEELKQYLEQKFYIRKTGEQMTWDSYGLRGWHLDHIIPLISFDLTDQEQLLKACHYTNIQPLWAEDNLRKGAKISEEFNNA